MTNKITEAILLSDGNVTDHPILSIAIPTYKRSQYLEEAIESALFQTQSNLSYEIIVVNNDPNDDMQELINKYHEKNIRFYKNSHNIGMQGNIRKCYLLAKGDYVAYLHDDDLLLPNAVNLLAQYFIFNTGRDFDCLVTARYLLFSDTEEGRFRLRKAKQKKLLMNLMFPRVLLRSALRSIAERDCVRAWNNCYLAPTCGTCFTRQSLLDSDAFTENWLYSFDFDFFLRYSEKYNVMTLKEPVSVYRMAASASEKKEVQSEFYDCLRAFYKRVYPRYAFVRFFANEIAWFDYTAYKISPDTDDRPVPKKPSFIKYRCFMSFRIIYMAFSNLDVTRPVDGDTLHRIRQNIRNRPGRI